MAFLAQAAAVERDTTPTPAGLITLTINEFRRLFDALVLTNQTNHRYPAGMVTTAKTTPIPSPTIPLSTTP
jgi:hypothetical protein